MVAALDVSNEVRSVFFMDINTCNSHCSTSPLTLTCHERERERELEMVQHTRYLLTGSIKSRCSNSTDFTAVIITGTSSSPSTEQSDDNGRVTNERILVKREERWGVREDGD